MSATAYDRTKTREIKQEDKTISHSIIIINQRLDAIKGDATDSIVVELQTAVNALDAQLPYLDKFCSDMAHELLEEIQEWLTNAFAQPMGAPDVIESFRDQCNDLL